MSSNNITRFYAIRHWFRSLMPLADTRIGTTINDHGVVCSIHRCNSCGSMFTVTPKTDKVWGGCLGKGCPSYDQRRDMDKYFGNDGKIIPGTPIIKEKTDRSEK